MDLNRREFLGVAAAGIAGAVLEAEHFGKEQRSEGRRVRAIAFDGFVIFDARHVVRRTEEILPGRGAEFANLWRTRQFEYTWLRTAGHRYENFERVTEDALNFAAASLKLSLTKGQREQLLAIHRGLPAWPDVAEALAGFRRRGIKLVFLSNLTASLLDSNVATAKLGGSFEEHLTTDRVQFYKPSPRAYQMAVDAFGFQREEVVFAAFGGWDAAGAKWFGYPTVWVNRANAVVEELGVRPDVITPDISGLVKFVEGRG